MQTFLRKIPMALILSRIIIGILIVILSLYSKISDYRKIIAFLIVIGFLTDFFDGYLARLLGISTQHLRRLDTLVDRIFWLLVLYAVWLISANFLMDRFYLILLVLGLEGLNYLISFLRFRKEISTHAILSKFWAITLLLGFCDLILNEKSVYLFDISLFFGIISRIDTGLIMLILPRWDHDIPSFYHAILIRQGKTITRSKLFNG
jgi:phosphatidylglycerophosphate synthase